MTGILISVRNADEARLAAQHPVDLLDLKEPSHGALGQITPAARRLILRSLPMQLPKSIALGELLQWHPAEMTAPALSWLKDFHFAKIGLAGTHRLPDWRETWQTFQQLLPISTQLVGVAYSDYEICGAPAIEQVFEQVIESSAARARHSKGDYESVSSPSVSTSYQQSAILIDTFSKLRGTTVDLLGWKKLEQLVALARENQVLLVVAGSLKLEHLEQFSDLAPDYLGFRGAVCDDHRATLSAIKLAELLERWAKYFPTRLRGALPEST